YRSPDGSFQLSYPTGFVGFSKPLKTHKEEVNFKSEDTKGYEVGVVVDPVKLESLEKFGTPEEVGARVLKVEQGKDGTLETKLYGAFSEKQGDLTLYTLVRALLGTVQPQGQKSERGFTWPAVVAVAIGFWSVFLGGWMCTWMLKCLDKIEWHILSKNVT
ncbi:unnamed protein product, partial [Discosporangium mesarthrocarpum]